MFTRRTVHRWAAIGLIVTAFAVEARPAAANPQSRSLYAKGLVPFNNGRWDEAYKLFDEAVKADAEDAQALYYRGLTAARRGQPNVAIPDLERALRLEPQLPHAALDLGIAYFDTANYSEAKRRLEQAYASAADRFTAAFFLGLTHYREGDLDKARAYLAEAEKDPEMRPVAQYYSGLVLLRQGREAEGRVAMQQAAQGRADSEVAQAARAYLSGVPEARRPPVPGEERETKPWSVYGDVRFEYDSNVVLAPDDSDIKQAEGISGEGDGRSVLGFGGEYRLFRNDNSEVSASYNFYQSLHFQIHEFDLQGHRVQLQGKTFQGPVQLGLASTYDFYALNYQTFFQQVRVTPWLALPEGEAASTQIYYSFRGRDFFRRPYDPTRDDITNAVGIRQYGLLGSEDRIFSVGYQFDDDNTVADRVNGQDLNNEFENQGHQFDLGVQFSIAKLVTTQLSYLFRYEDYQFPNSRSPAGFRRHDSEHTFIIAFSHDLTEYLQLSLAYLGVANNSNIKEANGGRPFEYNRNIVSVGVQLRY